MSRRATSTSAFGVSRRESHDATNFYRRFSPPLLSTDDQVAEERAVDRLMVGDARRMEEVPDASVALVVTSPPYFAGKEYEEALGRDGVPATYLEYLEMLRDVFAECARKLEPGGRMAVNVANLGRRPYRSLSADVISILQDELRLLLRGEIVWIKQRGSSGSCAWGSFQRATNPVLRDTSERVVVASKGRFDRAVPIRERNRRGLPAESTMTRDDFMEYTLDVWEMPAESATRVGHPAPFPVELPRRLIEMYTYRGDLVLDPFAGSGSTAVAAVRAGRHYAGYDLDESYIRLAQARVAAEEGPVEDGAGGHGEGEWARARREGRSARDVAAALLVEAGFVAVSPDGRRPGGAEMSFRARDTAGEEWLFDVAGANTTHRGGLARTEVLWRVVARAAVLAGAGAPPPVVLSTHLPVSGTPGAEALAAVTGPGRPIRAVVGLLDPGAVERLRALRLGC
ncbi:MAG TPA: site-specific DNA-methyltransferase [Acidimicrobiales bacterium]|nr:site-specific DNA-methyltransferase [Acidimicrobiales bacterium]